MLSDLHIQLYKRHNEYQEVFDKVIEYLKTEKQNANISNNTNNLYFLSPLVSLVTFINRIT